MNIKQEVLKWAGKVSSQVIKYDTTILTALSTVGLGVTVYLACDATLKAKDKLDDISKKEDYTGEKLTTKEKAKEILPLYIPTGIAFISTEACMVGAHIRDTKKEARALSAYYLSTEAMREFEDKFKDTYSEKKLNNLKSEINKDKAATIYSVNKDHAIDTGHGTQLFIDGASGQLFKSDREYINRIFNDLNDAINKGDEISLNDICDSFGIRPTKYGDYYIFNKERTGIIEPTFDPQWTDDTQTETCTWIDYRNMPALSYCG